MEEKKLWMKQWREKNKVHIQEYIRKYRENNKEKILKQAREYNHRKYYADKRKEPRPVKPRPRPTPKPIPEIPPRPFVIQKGILISFTF